MHHAINGVKLFFDFKDGRGGNEWSLVGTVMDVGGGGGRSRAGARALCPVHLARLLGQGREKLVGVP